MLGEIGKVIYVTGKRRGTEIIERFSDEAPSARRHGGRYVQSEFVRLHESSHAYEEFQYSNV